VQVTLSDTFSEEAVPITPLIESKKKSKVASPSEPKTVVSEKKVKIERRETFVDLDTYVTDNVTKKPKKAKNKNVKSPAEEIEEHKRR